MPGIALDMFSYMVYIAWITVSTVLPPLCLIWDCLCITGEWISSIEIESAAQSHPKVGGTTVLSSYSQVM